jgi:hypothetical protein
VAPSNLTVAAYLEERWLPAKAATLAPSTHASYSRNVRCHIPRDRLGTATGTQRRRPDALLRRAAFSWRPRR